MVLDFFRFGSTMVELARGAEIPSILPVWQRHLLSACDPPHVSYMHHEYENIPDTKETLIPLDNMVQRSFFFGPGEISALRRHLPLHLRRCTTFELLAACIWRCRTIAISPDPNEEFGLWVGHSSVRLSGERWCRCDPGLLSFNIPFTNNKGEKGKLVPICLPENAMEVFAKELETMVKRDDEIDLGDAQKSSIFIGLVLVKEIREPTGLR
ncbi:UNVERIFIED_CONTAM: Benzyl alcohol O-benzoyltransferase [Sesamum calycinum]|uniref:Benzyl alcohol O-benzoyltransferase n=1 Tax=Sesamum calycinum TaxID=2727403 RepID=A0AAW2J2L6_9LAMI